MTTRRAARLGIVAMLGPLGVGGGVTLGAGAAASPRPSPARAPAEPPAGDAYVAPALPWGSAGHEMAARAAARALPRGMPAFFLAAGPQLVYLDPEPDRWRDPSLREMNEAWSYDHYIDLENVPAPALDAADRFAYLRALYEAGLERPERDAGFLPFRIVEVYERLVAEWRLWRAATDAQERGWIEQRIVNDAGILGHYVTDGSQPHHTTIHFNGWDRDTPNPEGYTEDRTFHARFETAYVEARVTQADVDRRVSSGARSVAGSARPAVLEYLRATHAELETLYRLDRDVGFDPAGPLRAPARDFAADRLAAGATMLAVLWRSAWQEGTR